jgi:predicted Fe-Mo cluster-binding NifX family protein
MIAITVSEDKVNSRIEECFGKSEYFFVYDESTNKSVFYKNSARDLPKNSGKKAAEFLIKKGVKSVFSSNFGVPVKKLFDKHGVQMVLLSPLIKSLRDLKWIEKGKKAV